MPAHPVRCFVVPSASPEPFDLWSDWDRKLVILFRHSFQLGASSECDDQDLSTPEWWRCSFDFIATIEVSRTCRIESFLIIILTWGREKRSNAKVLMPRLKVLINSSELHDSIWKYQNSEVNRPIVDCLIRTQFSAKVLLANTQLNLIPVLNLPINRGVYTRVARADDKSRWPDLEPFLWANPGLFWFIFIFFLQQNIC